MAKALGMRIYSAIGNHMDYSKGVVIFLKKGLKLNLNEFQ
jgi:hypothetical protein